MDSVFVNENRESSDERGESVCHKIVGENAEQKTTKINCLINRYHTGQGSIKSETIATSL